MPTIHSRLLLPLLLTAFASVAPAPAKGGDFPALVARLNTLPTEQRQAVVDSFIGATPQLPVVDADTIASFIYVGTASSVTVPGDANGWNGNAFPMTRVEGTTLWYHTRTFERDARLDYKFVLNGNNWILDPRNPFQVSGGFGPNSELRMPGYPPAPEVQYYPAIPHGSLRDTTWFSTFLGNSRTIRIYTPPGYDASTDSCAVVYLHDGLEYSSLGSANNILDYLISEGRIRPLIGVFIPPVNRTAEYAGSSTAAFTRFMVEELVPYVDARYRTKRTPVSRAVIGASNGGNISLWLGYHHPEVFGNAGAYSSNIVDSLKRGFSAEPRKELTLYLDLGTYDLSVLIPLVRGFVPILESQGYRHEYREYHEGHSWGNWRAHLDNSLELFFGTATSVGELQGDRGVPAEIELLPNYPNPFNPVTTIRYGLSHASTVRLDVFNAIGQRVALLVEGEQEAGYHEVNFDGTTIATGVFYCRMLAEGRALTRRLLLLR